jgi:hypothetical protein
VLAFLLQYKTHAIYMVVILTLLALLGIGWVRVGGLKAEVAKYEADVEKMTTIINAQKNDIDNLNVINNSLQTTVKGMKLDCDARVEREVKKWKLINEGTFKPKGELKGVVIDEATDSKLRGFLSTDVFGVQKAP